jgi:hypothetical protein
VTHAAMLLRYLTWSALAATLGWATAYAYWVSLVSVDSRSHLDVGLDAYLIGVLPLVASVIFVTHISRWRSLCVCSIVAIVYSIVEPQTDSSALQKLTQYGRHPWTFPVATFLIVVWAASVVVESFPSSRPPRSPQCRPR